MKRRLVSIILITALITGCFTVVSFGASKTKKMTAYSCVRDGNMVYCAAAGGVFRVDLNSRTSVMLASSTDTLFYEPTKALTLHKGYVYYLDSISGDVSLYRVPATGGSRKKLAADIKGGYAISKNKIYFKTKSKSKTVKKQMNLNGKKKKSSKYNVKMTKTATNDPSCYVFTRANSQEIVYDEGGSMREVHCTDLLMTPTGSAVPLFNYTVCYDN